MRKKRLGFTLLDILLKAREEGPFKSFIDFCERVDLKKVNKRVIEALIKAGAFDSLGHKRAQLMMGLAEVMERAQMKKQQSNALQLSLFDLGANSQEESVELPNVDEWSEDLRLAYEKEALGFYLTGHPLKGYEETLKELSNTNTEELKTLADHTPVMLGGIITELKETSSRKGERMAFVTLEDLRGKVEVIVFSNLYREAREYFTSDQPIFITGHLSKDENAVKVIADKVYFLAEAREKLKALLKQKKIEEKERTKPKSILIVLQEDEVRREQLLRLKGVLSQHRGTCPVYFQLRPAGTLISLPAHLRVKPTKAFITHVNTVLGYEAVQVRDELSHH
jgi:DNA polymerase-3 subunit alpha